jgi:hypothetical protein
MEISSDRPAPINATSITPADGKPKRKTLSKSNKPAESSRQAVEVPTKKVTITSKSRKSAPKAAAKPAPVSESADIEIISQQLTKTPVSELSSEAVRSMIATAAYYIAEQRHFAPGMELDDWLAAERQFLHAAS